MPARLYGWGFRSLADTCGPAWLGMLETALPFMAGRGQICPQLGDAWGGEECWGERAPKEERWRKVLDSGCAEGTELRRVWGRLFREAQLTAAWLGEEVPPVLATPLLGLGDGSVTGATRGKVITAVENLRAKALDKALQEVRPKSTRAAWAWKQRDKVSSAWLLAAPGHDTTLSSAEFSEAAASNLCLPSPACRGRVCEVIRGRVTVDHHGDNIQATSLKGDHWRSRHNAMLHHLYNECVWAGMPVELEVHNLFSSCMQQQGLSSAERGRQYQGIVPDMRITLPGVGGAGGVGAPGLAAGGLAGQSSSVLHKLKIISSCRYRYRPSWKDRAVDIRAAEGCRRSTRTRLRQPTGDRPAGSPCRGGGACGAEAGEPR